MARVLIEPAKARGVLSLESDLQKSLSSIANDLDQVRNGLSYRISSRELISAKLREAYLQIIKEADSTQAMREGIQQIITTYEKTERNNSDLLSHRNDTNDIVVHAILHDMPMLDYNGFLDDMFRRAINDIISNLLKEIGGNPFWNGPFSPLIQLLPLLTQLPTDGEVKDEHEFKVNLKQIIENNKKKDKKNDKDEFKWKKDIGKKQLYYKDLKTGEITRVDPEDKDAVRELKKHNKIPVDVKLAGIGANGSISASEWKDEQENFEWSASAAKLEGNIDGYIGAAGIGAGVGVGFTLFTADEKAYLGSEDLNVYEKVQFDAGKAEGKAGFSAGLLDTEGNFNPNLYAEASAEAMVAEVTGEVGLDTPYGDIGIEGGVNFGIGAHANVGLHDGKLSVDIGASLGVGASLKLDVDLSETFDAVADVYDCVVDKAGDILSGIKNFLLW